MENFDLVVGIPVALLIGVICGAVATHKWWEWRITKWGG